MSHGLSRSGSATTLEIEIGSISLTQSTGIGLTNWLASLSLPYSFSYLSPDILLSSPVLEVLLALSLASEMG